MAAEELFIFYMKWKTNFYIFWSGSLSNTKFHFDPGRVEFNFSILSL